jgi:hypothetical protein
VSDAKRLALVQQTEPGPREKARLKIKANRLADIVQCNRCGGREFIETKTGVTYRDGKYLGGTKALICVSCLLTGHRQT